MCKHQILSVHAYGKAEVKAARIGIRTIHQLVVEIACGNCNTACHHKQDYYQTYRLHQKFVKTFFKTPYIAFYCAKSNFTIEQAAECQRLVVKHHTHGGDKRSETAFVRICENAQ